MLAQSWEEKRHDKRRRTNLFRDLSRIMLSLGRTPLARIGSFTLDNEGVLSLTNRPLTMRLNFLENLGTPTNIARDDTYTAVEPYLLDLLSYHDNRLLHQPNSISDKADCRAQMAVITGMRAILPHFIERDLRHGPFLFSLTDMQPANIFVDEELHIKCVIDLEWACALPVEMQNPPHWLTNRDLDDLADEHLTPYDDVRREFMEAFENEEKRQEDGNLHMEEKDCLLRTRTMRRVWETGGFFYFHALENTSGLFNLFLQHIWPKFPSSTTAMRSFDEAVSPFWGPRADAVTLMKLEDKEVYEAQLRALFKDKAQ